MNEEEKKVRDAIERYTALSYGYSKVGYMERAVGSSHVLSPEEEEFVNADRALEEVCIASRPGCEHVQAIADGEEFVIFERKVGTWTHRFRSRFKASADGKISVLQFTEIVAPPPFKQTVLTFPLVKDLGEAGCLFQSALVLCNMLADSSCLLNGYVTGTRHKIVEIGSGTGVLGIAAAMLGCRITVTDLPHVVPQIKQNVDQNLAEDAEMHARVTCMPLAWGNSEHSATLGKVDLVLCSDCVYREETHSILVQTLLEVSHSSTLIVLALEIRRFPVEQKFFDLAITYFTVDPVVVNFKEDNDVKVFFLRPHTLVA